MRLILHSPTLSLSSTESDSNTNRNPLAHKSNIKSKQPHQAAVEATVDKSLISPDSKLSTKSTNADSKAGQISATLSPSSHSVQLDGLEDWSYVKAIKDQIADRFFIPQHSQRLFFKYRELINKRTLAECDLSEGDTITLLVVQQNAASSSLATLLIRHSESMEQIARQKQTQSPSLADIEIDQALSQPLSSTTSHSSITASAKPSPSVDEAVSLISVAGSLQCSPRLRSLIDQASLGLSLGLKPKLTEDGTGGTYILSARSHNHAKIPVAILKPSDEELWAPCNPRGYSSSAIGSPVIAANSKGSSNASSSFSKVNAIDTVLNGGAFAHDSRGIAPTEGAIREVAAWMLDHGNFANVPQTTFVKVASSVFEGNSMSMATTLQSGALTCAQQAHSQYKMCSFQEFVS